MFKLLALVVGTEEMRRGPRLRETEAHGVYTPGRNKIGSNLSGGGMDGSHFRELQTRVKPDPGETSV